MSALELLVAVIRDHTPESIWVDSPVEGYRSVGNTNRGAIGEDFIRRYLQREGVTVDSGSRVTETDMRIAGESFEVKTASLGATGTFQFNHIRLDKPYKYLLCLGICPHDIVFNVWRKGVLSEGGAGTLVRMAEGQSTTHKLTKNLRDMKPIEGLPGWIIERSEGQG